MALRCVLVPVAVRAGGHVGMGVLVVAIVVCVGVFVVQGFVRVFMRVGFGQVQQHAQQHQRAAGGQQPAGAACRCGASALHAWPVGAAPGRPARRRHTARRPWQTHPAPGQSAAPAACSGQTAAPPARPEDRHARRVKKFVQTCRYFAAVSSGHAFDFCSYFCAPSRRPAAGLAGRGLASLLVGRAGHSAERVARQRRQAEQRGDNVRGARRIAGACAARRGRGPAAVAGFANHAPA